MLRKLGVVKAVSCNLQKQGGSHKSLSSSSTSAAGGGASSFADLLKKGNLDGGVKVTDTQPVTQGKPSQRKWVPNHGKTVQGDNNGSTDVPTTGRSIPSGQRKTWAPKTSAGSTAASATVPSSRNGNTSNKFSFNLDAALTNDRRSNNRDTGTAPGGNETGSVRDSLRRAAQRNQAEHHQGGGPDGGMRVMGDSTAAEEVNRIWHQQSTNEHNNDTDRNAGVLTDARAVRADILDHIANREMKPDPLVDVDVVGTAGIPLDEVEITEGELRYRQYQERLRIEKEQFRRKLPPPETGPKFRRPSSSSSSSSGTTRNIPYCS